jgi:hypothetical protein
MKKIFLFLTAAFIPLLVIQSSTNAQNSKLGFDYAKNSKKAFVITDPGYFKTFIDTVTDAGTANNVATDIKTISTRAIKNFNAEFGKTVASKWFKLLNGFVAHFTVDNILNRSYYDKRGNWLYSTQYYYDEKKLPKEVRAIVKSTYYDYSISGIQEIHVEDKIVFLVSVKDETSWKKIRVCDGEMQELATYKNGL